MQPEAFGREVRWIEETFTPPTQRAHDGQGVDTTALRGVVESLSSALAELRVAERALRVERDELLAARDEAVHDRQRYQDLFDFAPDGYLVTDESGAIRIANRGAARLMHRDASMLHRGPLSAFVDRRDHKRLRAGVSRLVQGGGELAIALRMTPHEAPPFVAQVRVIARCDAATGAPTLRWSIRHALARDLTSLVASVPHACFVGTAKGVTCANALALRQFGCSTLADLFTIVHGNPSFVRALEGHRTTGELTINRRDDECPRMLRFAAAPLQSKDASPGVLVTISDVTEERERLKAILDLLPVGVMFAESPSGKATVVNTYLRRLLAATRANGTDMAEQLRQAAYLPDGRQVEPEAWPPTRAVRRGETVMGDDLRLRRTDGARASVRVSAAPLFDGAGEISGAIATVVDIDRHQRLVDELRQLRADAEEARHVAEMANRAKSEFLAVMSHELRTPLNAIRGYVDLLDLELRGPLNEAQRADLARIRKNERRLLALINDVLAFARIEAGALEYAVTDVPVSVVLGDLAPTITPQMMRKQIAFECATPDASILMRADEERVQQVLVNLVSNAIKFTECGGTVGITTTVTDACVAFNVRDTGRGIPTDRLGVIFDPFVQVDRALNSPAEGMGLGLAISRTLARAMGGDVTVASILGAGSTFTLTVPRA